ncbi:MAG: hypothetical protein HOP30_08530 [Cyclobacteriaceae bacterium]|nr:hypothetical protein [Cyclobacteriaceae bacterium]
MNYRLLGLLLLLPLLSCAQDLKQDTVALSADSIRMSSGKVVSIETYARRFNPRRALLYSAILPGMGQVYNKKYWKVPLVYGGLVGLILVVDFYNQKGNQFRNDLFDLLNSPNGTILSPNGFTEAQLRNGIEITRRQRDYFMIFTGFMYLLQLIDAHVDAHLKEFDLNPKLKVSIVPMMDNNYYTGTNTGVTIKLRF